MSAGGSLRHFIGARYLPPCHGAPPGDGSNKHTGLKATPNAIVCDVTRQAARLVYDTTRRAVRQSAITSQPEDLLDRCLFGQDVHDP